MTAIALTIGVLLALAIVVEVLACTGVMAMRTTMQRLHFVAPASCVGPWFVGIAILLGTHATGNQAPKAVLIALLLTGFSGVLSHETALAALSRKKAD